MKTNKAFTLSEVLVTLMIIGVIAAVTIPTLNQNIKDKQFVSGCLKADSVLSQAVNKMKLEYGPIGLGSRWNNKDEVWNGLVKQLNTVEVCSVGQNGCFYNSKIKNLNGSYDSDYSLSSQKEYRLITTDGMLYSFDVLNSAGHSGLKGLSEEDAKNCMGRFLVDVNGHKGPNVLGRDVFCFVLVRGKGIVPAGSNDYSDCTYSGKGHTCAGRVIKEKKIDYPKS